MRDKPWGEGFGCRRRWEVGRHWELLGGRRWGWRGRWGCRSRGRLGGLLEFIWRGEVPRWAGKPLLQRLLQPGAVDRVADGSRSRRGREGKEIGLWSRWKC